MTTKVALFDSSVDDLAILAEGGNCPNKLGEERGRILRIIGSFLCRLSAGVREVYR